MTQVVQEKGTTSTTREEQFQVLRMITQDYQKRDGDLLPVLRMAIGIFGRLTYDVQRFIADEIRVPLGAIGGSLTFADCFADQRCGRHTIQVCLGASCYTKGGQEIFDYLREELNLEVGETTEDGMFTLELKECDGQCEHSPAMMVDGDLYKDVRREQIGAILAKYR